MSLWANTVGALMVFRDPGITEVVDHNKELCAVNIAVRTLAHGLRRSNCCVMGTHTWTVIVMEKHVKVCDKYPCRFF